MKLSKRLETVAQMVPENLPCADIGADHGYLVKFLIDNNKIPFAYASDNKKGPFMRLASNLESYINKGLVEVSLQDGLNNLPNKYRTIVICGMGGDLIREILSSNLETVKEKDYLLLAPHGKEKELRLFLSTNGFEIIDEEVVYEGHYYEIILFKNVKKIVKYDEIQLNFGPVNLKKKSEIFKNKYLDLLKSNKEIFINPFLKEKRKNDVQSTINNLENMIKTLF